MKLIRVSYAVLVSCTLGHLMHHAYVGVLSPFLPLIQDELQLTLTEVGIVSSTAAAIMTVSHLAVGYFSDRGWRDIFVPASILAAAFAVLLTSFATTFVFLVVAQSILGLGASLYHPAAFPALTDHFPSEERAKATGVLAIGGLLGSAAIPVVGVLLLQGLGTWQSSLAVLGVAGFIIFIPALMLISGESKACYLNGIGTSEPDGDTGWSSNFKLLMVVSGLRGVPFQCTALLMPLYLSVYHGYSIVWAGAMTSIMMASGLFAEAISGPLSDRMHKRVPLIAISTALMTPFLLLLNLKLEPLPLLVVLVNLGFWYYWGVPPSTALETEVSPKRSRGLAFGLLFSLGAVPGAISPMIFGIIGDAWGLQASILFIAVTTTLATGAAFFLKETRVCDSFSEGGNRSREI